MLVVGLLGRITAAAVGILADASAPASVGFGAAGIEIGMACSCGSLGVDDWALNAAAMAMAPLMPVPATRQITVE